MNTTIEQHSFKRLAGTLVNLPQIGEIVILLHSGMSEAEKLNTTIALQVAFAQLSDVQKLFPVQLTVDRKPEPRVMVDHLRGIAGMIFNYPGAKPRIVVSDELSEVERVCTIARAMAFWQALTDEQLQQSFRAVL